MIVSADVKSLEVVVCAFLSQDSVLCDEVRQKVDFHELNKKRFGLPDRVTAKRFKFKLIYGASAFGYANDSDFLGVSTSTNFWQGIIDEYYTKYSGIRNWHTELVKNAIACGIYTSPSGRRYDFPSREVVAKDWYWRPKILNYPVQGLGADLVMIGRISMWNRIKNEGLADKALPIMTVHDSVVFDVVDNKPEVCYNIGRIMKQSVVDIPMNFERLFGTEFNLPLDAELKFGPNLGKLETMNVSNS
jgi:DNA polymerase I-like protein with 3'-5' exonuclease and polymerase domains